MIQLELFPHMVYPAEQDWTPDRMDHILPDPSPTGWMAEALNDRRMVFDPSVEVDHDPSLYAGDLFSFTSSEEVGN